MNQSTCTLNSSKSDRLKNKIKLEMEKRRKKQLAKKSKLEISKIKKQAKYVKKREKVRSLHQYLNPKLNGSPHPLILIGAKQMENIKDNCTSYVQRHRRTSDTFSK
jgi:beta-lactamase regulating signal transducer with metallopeptidase domain